VADVIGATAEHLPAGDEKAEQADRTGSDDTDPCPANVRCLAQCVQGVGEWLDHGGGFPVDAVGQDVQGGSGDRHPFGEPTRPVHAEQAALTAHLRETATAQVALATAQQRVDRHPAAGRVGADDLVAHHQRRLAEAETAEPVQLAAADARRLDVDDHVAVTRERSVEPTSAD